MRRKYGLAPTDSRFLAMTPEDCEAEFWAHWYADNAGKGEEFEDEDFDLESILSGAASDEWETLIDG